MTYTIDNGIPAAYEHESELYVRADGVIVRCQCGSEWTYPGADRPTTDEDEGRLLADWTEHVGAHCGLNPGPAFADAVDIAVSKTPFDPGPPIANVAHPAAWLARAEIALNALKRLHYPAETIYRERDGAAAYFHGVCVVCRSAEGKPMPYPCASAAVIDQYLDEREA